jgi:hypothetical protein
MVGVRNEIIHNKGMYNAKDGVLKVTEGIKVSTKSNAVLGGKNRIRGVRLHNTIDGVSPDL